MGRDKMCRRVEEAVDLIHDNMLDLDEFTKIIEEGLDGLPEETKQRHRAQLLAALGRSLSQKAGAVSQRLSSPELGLLSIRELKRLAKQAGVYRYGSLDKAGLVSALANLVE